MIPKAPFYSPTRVPKVWRRSNSRTNWDSHFGFPSTVDYTPKTSSVDPAKCNFVCPEARPSALPSTRDWSCDFRLADCWSWPKRWRNSAVKESLKTGRCVGAGNQTSLRTPGGNRIFNSGLWRNVSCLFGEQHPIDEMYQRPPCRIAVEVREIHRHLRCPIGP